MNDSEITSRSFHLRKCTILRRTKNFLIQREDTLDRSYKFLYGNLRVSDDITNCRDSQFENQNMTLTCKVQMSEEDPNIYLPVRI